MTAVFLEHIKKKEIQECWWCGQTRQTMAHLFKWYKRWNWQQNDLWRWLEKKCNWKQRLKVPMSQVFDTDVAVKPVLKFLKESDIGKDLGVREGVEDEG